MGVLTTWHVVLKKVMYDSGMHACLVVVVFFSVHTALQVMCDVLVPFR